MHAAPWMKNRWIIAVSGTIVMMTLGTIYSWSLFTQPLVASFGWSNTTTTWTFAAAIFSLGLGAIAGGRWQDRAGPRKVALTGVLMWGLGNFLAGLGTADFGAVWMYLTYGLLGGFGAGMAYVAPIAVVTKWFPGQRGLGSGMVAMGFGLGAVVYNLIVKSIPSFAAAAEAAAGTAAQTHIALQPILGENDVAAVMNVFIFSGIGFALIAGACACLLVNPDIGSVPTTESAARDEFAYTTREMLRTPQFVLLWLMLLLNVTAGILVISNAVPIMQDLTGLMPADVAAIYGGVALFNGLGRLFWGALSDRIGRNFSFALIFGTQSLVFGLLGGFHGIIAVAIAFAVVLLCFGGGFGTMPSFIADYFGTRHLGANYGIVLSAWGVAGIAGPLFAAHIKDTTGSFSGALMPVAIMLLVAMLLPMITRKPARAESGTENEAVAPDPSEVFHWENVDAKERFDLSRFYFGSAASSTSTGVF